MGVFGAERLVTVVTPPQCLRKYEGDNGDVKMRSGAEGKGVVVVAFREVILY